MIFGTVFSMIFFRRDKNSSFKFSNFQTVIFISISEGRANVTIPNLHRSELLYFSIAFYAVGRADGRRLPAPLVYAEAPISHGARATPSPRLAGADRGETLPLSLEDPLPQHPARAAPGPP